jgi:hypothetical protein
MSGMFGINYYALSGLNGFVLSVTQGFTLCYYMSPFQGLMKFLSVTKCYCVLPFRAIDK